MYTELKKRVLEANIYLKTENLIKLTWGNVSEIDRENKVVAIKPSGVDYDKMQIDDIVIVDLKGNTIEGKLKASSDLETHLEIYRSFPEIGGITHTHSTYATSFAQAKKPIKCYGTTHADSFSNTVVVARELSSKEIFNDYEYNTGVSIVESLKEQQIDPLHNPGILLPNHAPFTFGVDGFDSARNALILEEVAKMAYLTEHLNVNVCECSEDLRNKHYDRKHGENSYYGQET